MSIFDKIVFFKPYLNLVYCIFYAEHVKLIELAWNSVQW
jgi:hypothetical protein